MNNKEQQAVINEIKQRIIETAHPVRIILFGSTVRHEEGPHSDFDFLVVVASDQHRRETAKKIYRSLIGVGYAADIVVVKESDLDRYADCPGMIIHEALKEGKILYAA